MATPAGLLGALTTSRAAAGSQSSHRRRNAGPGAVAGFGLVAETATVWEHTTARVDVSGRVRLGTLTDALGWAADAALGVEVGADRATFSPTPTGTVAVDGAGRLRLPVSVRRIVGGDTGAGVLLSADLDTGRLVVVSLRALDALAVAS